MEATEGSRRRRHAAANDVAFHEGALRLLAERGLDRCSFSDLAREAGVSRAPLYARYDSMEDLAVDLWQRRLTAELDHIIMLARDWFTSENEQPSVELLSLCVEPGVEASALVELMAVARRFPYVHDIVQNTVDERFATRWSNSDEPAAVAAVELSVIFGAILLAPIFGAQSQERWAEVLRIARSVVCTRDTWGLPSIPGDPVELPIVGVVTGDELLDTFVPAVMRVVARTGYEHASANRIGREAGRDFNATYGRFSSKDELMTFVVGSWVDAGVNVGLTPFIGIEPQEYVRRSVTAGRSLVSPKNRLFRNLRNEMTLAARHHQAVARDINLRFDHAAESGRERLERLYEGLTDEVFATAQMFTELVRYNGFGLCLLASCSGALTPVDWTPVSTALQRVIWAHLFSELTLR